MANGVAPEAEPNAVADRGRQVGFVASTSLGGPVNRLFPLPYEPKRLRFGDLAAFSAGQVTMTDADRHRLFFGPYAMPAVRVGHVVTCEFPDADAVVTALSDALIPWPVGLKTTQRGGRPSHLVFGDLAAAVRRESVEAVAHWWGVAPAVVSKWRTALGVPHDNEGTKQLAEAAATDPDRRTKIAAAKVGKKRPRHVVEAMKKGRTGKPHTEEARRKMSEASRRRRAWPPAAGRAWTRTDDASVEKLTPKDAADQTGRTLRAVYSRRHGLKAKEAVMNAISPALA